MISIKLFSAFASLALVAQAQWLDFPTPGVPRLRDGKPDLSAPAPHTADGRPDLTGTWMHETTTVAEVRKLFGKRFDSDIELAPPGMEIGTQHKYVFNILLDYKAGEVGLTQAAQEIMRKRAAQRNAAAVCVGVPGIPVADLLSEPIKIVQAPRETMILYEVGNLHRQIFADGRKLPKEFDLPAYVGYSAGYWEGETFVVETAGFNDKTALDVMGHPHSESLRVTERFHRRDYGHLDYEMTFDDPVMYTKPFTIKIPHELMADADVFESYCDNEKDSVHLGKK
jgi:hypothetical protein